LSAGATPRCECAVPSPPQRRDDSGKLATPHLIPCFRRCADRDGESRPVRFDLPVNPMIPVSASTVRAALACAVLVLGACGKAPDGVLASDVAFRDFVLEVTTQRVPELPLAPGKDARELTSGEAVLGLDNLRSRCEAGGATREACTPLVVEHFQSVAASLKQALDQPPQTWAGAEPRLRLQLVTEDYARTAPSGMAWRPWIPGVLRAIAVDGDKGFALISQQTTALWQVPDATIDAAAEAGLQQASADVGWAVSGIPPTMIYLSQSDGYDAARLLLPSTRAKAADILGEPFFAAIPHRDFLVMWSTSADAEFQRKIRFNIRNDFEKRPYPLSPTVLRVTRETIEPVEEASTTAPAADAGNEKG
jgi:hypothetical protein